MTIIGEIKIDKMKEQSNDIKITKIYLVTNCNNDPNKVYIGKTKNSRKYHHQQTYGKNITYDYIDEVKSLSKKDWEPLESYWLEQFKQWGFEVVNKRKIGGSGPEFMTEEICRKISEGKKGKKHKPYSNKGKPNYKLRGPNPKISESKKGKPNFKNRGPNSNKGKHLKVPVNQLDLHGNFIKTWPSRKEAGEALGIGRSDIVACCNGRQKTAGGFKWDHTEK